MSPYLCPANLMLPTALAARPGAFLMWPEESLGDGFESLLWACRLLMSLQELQSTAISDSISAPSSVTPHDSPQNRTLSPLPLVFQKDHKMPSWILTQTQCEGEEAAGHRSQVFVLASLLANNSIYHNPSPLNGGPGGGLAGRHLSKGETLE